MQNIPGVHTPLQVGQKPALSKADRQAIRAWKAEKRRAQYALVRKEGGGKRECERRAKALARLKD